MVSRWARKLYREKSVKVGEIEEARRKNKEEIRVFIYVDSDPNSHASAYIDGRDFNPQNKPLFYSLLPTPYSPTPTMIFPTYLLDIFHET